MKKNIFAFTMIVLLLISFSSCSFAADRTYKITETYYITADRGEKVYLQIHIPMSNGYQRIEDVKASNAASITFDETYTYQIITLTAVGIGEQTEVKLSYNAALLNNDSSWPHPTNIFQTMPDEFIFSMDNDIIDKSKQLNGEDKSQTAENIINFVATEISTVKANKAELKTAPETLKQKSGSSADKANLAVALLRASKIQSVTTSGINMNQIIDNINIFNGCVSDFERADNAWVDLFADGEWRFADVTNGALYSNTEGLFLSYGDSPINGTAYREKIMLDLQKDGYNVISECGDLPIYVAYSENGNASVTASLSINNWYITYFAQIFVILAVSAMIVMLIFSIFKSIIRTKNKVKN